MSLFNLSSSPFNPLFALSAFGFSYQGYKISKITPYFGYAFVTAGIVDSLFHLTGEKHSISQHAVAAVILIPLFGMTNKFYKKSTFLGVTGASIIVLTLVFAFLDGYPGSPGFDVFKSPGPKDPHYTLSHIINHALLHIFNGIFIYHFGQTNEDKKK